MSVKYQTPMECVEDGLPYSHFFKQFTSVVPVVGETYVQAPGTWQEKTFKILFVGDGVALGTCVGSKDMGDLCNGKKELFHADGHRAGWKYHDIRSIYRLHPIE